VTKTDGMAAKLDLLYIRKTQRRPQQPWSPAGRL